MAGERINTMQGTGVRPWNENLLDNWDFRNPVNQKGKTEYTNSNEITADRWLYENGTSYGTVSIEEGFVTVSHLGAAGVTTFLQKLENAPSGTVTFSALTRDGTLATLTGSFADNTTASHFLPDVAIILSNSRKAVQFTVRAGGTMSLVAAKLEEGPVQTLAHKENGEWVLNRRADYGLELLKCQRHQLFPGNGRLVAVPAGKFGSAYINLLPTPVPFRGKPTIVGNPSLWTISGNIKQENAVITVNFAGPSGIEFLSTGISEPCILLFMGAGDGLDDNL